MNKLLTLLLSLLIILILSSTSTIAHPSSTQQFPNQSNFEIEQNIKLIIYDLLGNKVEILVNRKQKHGHYDVNFNSRNMTTGVYLTWLIVRQFNDY